MTSYGSTSFAATSGTVTAVSISSLGVNDGAASDGGGNCTCIVSCPGSDTPDSEQVVTGNMSGFIYVPTYVQSNSRAPTGQIWVACPELNWTPAEGSPAAAKSFPVPAGAVRVAWLPDSFVMSNGTALQVMSISKWSGL